MPHEKTPLRPIADWRNYKPSSDPSAPLDVYSEAAWMVEDAARGIPTLHYSSRGALQRDRNVVLTELNLIYNVYTPALFVLLGMSIFETPLWCRNSAWTTWESAEVQCPSPDGSPIYLSGLPYLPKMHACLVEGACIWVILRACLTRLQEKYAKHTQIDWIQLALCGLMLLDFLVFTLLNQVYDWDIKFRLAGYFRIGLFFCLPNMQHGLTNLVGILKEFLDVATLLFATIIFFAWVAAMALDDVHIKNHAGGEVNEGFETFGQALYTLFEASTTQKFPGQMLPTFLKYRASVLFFLAFMFLTVMVFLNLALAIVYNAYSSSKEAQMKRFFQNRAGGLAKAFKLLATQRDHQPANELSISKNCFGKLIQCLNQSPVIKTVYDHEVELYWQTLDDDCSGDIQSSEFYDLCDILQFQFQRVPAKGWWRSAPASMEAFVRGTGSGCCSLDLVVSVTLVVNSIFLFVESYQDLQDLDAPFTTSQWTTINSIFSALYLIELVIRLCIVSFAEYWSDWNNRLEVSTTLVLVLISIAWMLPAINFDGTWLRYFMILRVLQLLRLLASNQRFGFICSCISRVLLASKEAVGLLFSVMYLYATVGCTLYGGLVYDGNHKLDGTDYRTNNYDILNFNDMGLAMVALVVMLLTSYVPDYYDAFATLGSPSISSFFWISFYGLGILISFNVFCAFIIDVFISEYENKDKSIVEDELQSLKQEGEQKVLATFHGSDDIFKKMFMDSASHDDSDPEDIE